MTDLTDLTIAQAIEGMKNKSFSATELTSAYVDNMQKNKRLERYECEKVWQSKRRIIELVL